MERRRSSLAGLRVACLSRWSKAKSFVLRLKKKDGAQAESGFSSVVVTGDDALGKFVSAAKAAPAEDELSKLVSAAKAAPAEDELSKLVNAAKAAPAADDELGKLVSAAKAAPAAAPAAKAAPVPAPDSKEDEAARSMQRLYRGKLARTHADAVRQREVLMKTKVKVKMNKDEQITQLNDYKVGKILGQGAYGIVYKASGPEHGEVAVKVLNRAVLSKKKQGEGTALDGVLKEIGVMKKLRHPNCVQLWEVSAASHARPYHTVHTRATVPPPPPPPPPPAPPPPLCR